MTTKLEDQLIAVTGSQFLSGIAKRVNVDNVYNFLECRWDSENADQKYLINFISRITSTPSSLFNVEAAYAYSILLSLELAASDSAAELFSQRQSHDEIYADLSTAEFLCTVYCLSASWWRATIISEQNVLQTMFLAALRGTLFSVADFAAVLFALPRYGQGNPLLELNLDMTHLHALQYCCCMLLADLVTEQIPKANSQIASDVSRLSLIRPFIISLRPVLIRTSSSDIQQRLERLLG